MTYLAADGKTKQQLEDVLGGTASTAEVRLHFAKLLATIENVENENYILRLTNRFYVRQEFRTKESFIRTLQYYYNEKLYNFNYGEKYKFVQEINKWISGKTNNKITELITADSVSDDIKMLLLNAIHFSGTWKTQFMKDVTMMVTTYVIPYFEDDFVQVVKMPYVGNEIEMVFILPKIRFGLSNVLQNLTGSDLVKYIHNAKLTLSSFKILRLESKGKLNLKKTLANIGITDAFSTAANFKELTKDKISVGSIIHAGFIAVDEKGTESAAATKFDLIDRISLLKYFHVDQPFLFAIVKGLKTILFAGQFA
ncbi:Heterochromatin-associated protein MENT [Dirofilaria immitis]